MIKDNLEVGPQKRTIRQQQYRALLDAGVGMARNDGPQGVVLAEAARRVGVESNDVYSHFADQAAFLRAVADVAHSVLAVAIETELAAASPEQSHADRARDSLRAVGRGYLRFALSEPGLFRTAFAVSTDLTHAHAPGKRGKSGRTPFELLCDALDGMVESGILPPDRRPAAEFLAWSTVHGFAMLLIDGPMLNVEESRAMAMGERLLDMVEHGLPATRPARG